MSLFSDGSIKDCNGKAIKTMQDYFGDPEEWLAKCRAADDQINKFKNRGLIYRAQENISVDNELIETEAWTRLGKLEHYLLVKRSIKALRRAIEALLGVLDLGYNKRYELEKKQEEFSAELLESLEPDLFKKARAEAEAELYPEFKQLKELMNFSDKALVHDEALMSHLKEQIKQILINGRKLRKYRKPTRKSYE